MSNIKVIHFDSGNIDGVSLMQRLNSLCASLYRFDNNSVVVKYLGGAKDLYEALGDFIQGKNIFIIDVYTDNDSYWGFMNRELWSWLKENRDE